MVQEVVSCTVDEARDITDRIKACVEQTWSLLLEAHERGAWSALGYDRWEDYVRGEFDMTKKNSYRLLDQGATIRDLAEASKVSRATLSVSARAAEDIKPVLPAVVEQVREAVKDVPVEERPAVVAETIQETRKRLAQEKEEKLSAARTALLEGASVVEAARPSYPEPMSSLVCPGDFPRTLKAIKGMLGNLLTPGYGLFEYPEAAEDLRKVLSLAIRKLEKMQ